MKVPEQLVSAVNQMYFHTERFSLSQKTSKGTAVGPALRKLRAICSCPFGCYSRHSSSSSGGIRARTALVRCTLAWQPGQSVIMS